ncbi:MAG: hypothetical protein KGL95_13020, partial [Patescibacteria group bacterium]|nr:hypothetical protein [Patescibacteria group bacterium]
QYSIVDTTVGIPVENDSLATKMVGFNVTSPTYLPQGYQVRLIKIAKNIPWVTIFASKYPLTNETTNEEFFYNDTGILITYSKLSDRALKDHQWMWPMATTIKKVTIDGFDAGIEGIRKGQYNGYSYDQWADLVLFKDKILIGVRGFFSDDDLVKITKSMLENQK